MFNLYIESMNKTSESIGYQHDHIDNPIVYLPRYAALVSYDDLLVIGWF